MTGLMLILSYGGNAQRMLAQTQDSVMAKDTVRQVNVPRRSAGDNEYTPLERFLPPSPQAAALARYGEYPVSLATGIPEISIPLYEIKLGDYTLPISISYHASGIKVDDVASTVGLGWVLNAGGAVSRTICGAPDLREKTSFQNYYYRDYSHVQALYNQAKNGQNVDVLESLINHSLTYDSDTQSDRYSYSFGQKSGVFRYSHENGEFYPLNYQPLLIEVHAGIDSYFMITDTDGIEYYFTEQELSGVADDENMTDIGAWYLTEIKTPWGSINFTYMTATQDIIKYSYSQTTKIGRFIYNNESSSPYSFATNKEEVGYRHLKSNTKYLYRQKLLTQITWQGNKIEFSYDNNRNDIASERLTSILVKNQDQETLKTITLGNSRSYGYSTYNYRMMLDSISLSDEGTYTFQYNESGYLPDYNTDGNRYENCVSDFWGYYNGRNTTYHIPADVLQQAYNNLGEYFTPGISVGKMTQYSANRGVNFSYMSRGILTDVGLPTGGRTHYDYAANGSGTSIGGLHVKMICNLSADNDTLTKKEYEYSGGRATHEPIENMMSYRSYHNYFDATIDHTTICNYISCTSDPLIPLSNCGGSPVFFPTVYEKDYDGSRLIGKTRYDYSMGRLYDYDGHTSPTIGSYVGLLPPAINDEGSYTPLLLQKVVYNTNTTSAKYYETYTYNPDSVKNFSLGTKIVSVITASFVNGTSIALNPYHVQSDYILFRNLTGHSKTFSLVTKTVTDSELDITTTETYTYDQLLRTLSPKTVTSTNSDGKVFKTINVYPFECTSTICDSMYIKNYADQVVSSRQYAGDTFLKMDSTLYLAHNGWFYPYKQYEQRHGGSMFEKLQLCDYNTHGNPRTIIENQTDKTALIWSFNGAYPVARISGKTFAELSAFSSTSNKIGQVESAVSPETVSTRLLELRNLLPSDVLTTTYNYKPLFGVSAITAENGYTTYYDYGSDGKLSAIRDNSGPLQQFSYQYARPYTGSNDGTNFVQTKDMLSSTAGKITRQYYDGLGRPIETATDIAGKYVYTMQTYDQKGRVSQQWLPAVGDPSLIYRSSIQGLTDNPYPDEHAYSVTTYDALDRPVFIQTAGDAWHSAGKGITKEYITNAANSVKRYSAALDGSSLIKNGYYAANTLYGEKTTDEDGKSLTVFTDKRGRKVLERRGTNNDTYYVYDDLDQQRFVLSPQYQESGYKDTYGYEYRFDEKGRLAKKILPQCDVVQYWYDTAGRMKFMQDATLRTRGLYRFYLYDKYGRLCIQGTCTGCWRGEAVNTATYNTSESGFQNTGYTLGRVSDISGTITIETVNYYDSYNFIRFCNSVVSTSSSVSTTGLLTGLIRKASDGTTLTDAIYYDYKSRPIQTRSISLGSRLTTTTTSYKYWGDVYQTVQTDYPGTSTSATPTLTSTTTNNYNPTTGLLSNTTLSLKRGTATAVQKTIRANTYDDLGRVIKNTRNGSSSMAVSYAYNLHNWLKEVNGPGFHEWLYYNDFTEANCSNTKCYNGNISIQKWQASNDGQNRGYKFTYDALNRLSEAVYGANNFDTHQNRYNEKVIEYSANGMIKRFQRRGLKSDGIYGKVDNLHIHLDGNRPVGIIEDAGNQTMYGAMEFQSHSSAETQYGYDDNGSLVWDANKQIAHITYDNLNHPKEVQFTNGNRIQYVYSPDGQKLRATWQTAVGNIVVPLNTTTNLTSSQISSTTRTDYIGNVVYTGTSNTSSANVSLSKYLFEGGYATVTPTTQPVFHYFTQDHLGNNRAVVSQSGTVEQITHYYPFGGFFADQGTNSSLQPYKYNGKELDRMHGLDLYDYGARQYDPIVPMFTQQDPLAEKYYHLSPYVYCANNPVNYVDLHGDSIVVDKYGENLQVIGKDKKVYIRDNGKYTLIGEIGEKVNIDIIAGNVFDRNAKEAKAIKSPKTFVDYVKTGGEWDLKNKKGSIWKYARIHDTDFQYGNTLMSAEDVGNYNFGVVANSYGIPEQIALKGAGYYQIYSGTSSPNWIVGKLMEISTMTPSGIISTSREHIMLAPYGDDPKDQYWIQQGYKYK